MTANPKTKLVFHFGHHKTGSTSIQDAFATGRISLQDKSVCYPTHLAHNYLVGFVEKYADEGRLVPGTRGMPGLERISALLASQEYDYLVISGEDFEDIAPAKIRKVFDEFIFPHSRDEQIIGYIRPHAERMLSSYCEQMKTGLFSDSMAEFHQRNVSSKRFVYERRLAPWERFFGDKILNLSVMQRSLLREGSVVHDFVHKAFGPDADSAKIEKDKSSNTALCLEDLVFLKSVFQKFPGRMPGFYIGLGWEMARLLAREPVAQRRTKPAIHKKLAEALYHFYRKDAKRMDEKLCPQEKVFMNSLTRTVDTAPLQEQSYRPEDHFDDTARRHIGALANLAAELVSNSKENWREKFYLQRVKALHGGSIPKTLAITGKG